MRNQFKFYKQTDEMTCGATCLKMILKYYGKEIELSELVQLTNTTREGSSLLDLSRAAEKLNMRTMGAKVKLEMLEDNSNLPLIVYWNENHFVVVYKIKKDLVYVADPAHGLIKYNRNEFLRSWSNLPNQEGIVLLFETTPEFYKEGVNSLSKGKPTSIWFFKSYLSKYKRLIIQLFIGLILGSILQLILPVLTQSIVDKGIQNGDFNFINLILISQLMVFLGRTSIEIIRSYILMHISSRINIALVSDFFVKLMKLPISYFDSKMTGDLMQRINDNQRIENFLTGSSISTLFSLINFVIFSCVLAWYNLTILLVFITGSLIYFFWINFFLNQRADIDFKRFQESGRNQSKVIEMITGMQEIKLNNAERKKRWQWELLQIKLFKVNLRGLNLTTLQNSGSSLINELKNILITYLSAKFVIEGQITLGMMLSISYIIGQLNAPVLEMVSFIQHLQDAKLSFERLSEIHNRIDEDTADNEVQENFDESSSIKLKKISFKYEGSYNNTVLKNLNFEIESNKITAIVGSSGSGKTTLLKLLLQFYEPTDGIIKINDTDLKLINHSFWRSYCGVVMQEGFIFNDTIANNIAFGEGDIVREKLMEAINVANIQEFIENLPLGINTKIGSEGLGLSTGQKQRILIARAVYKNPRFLFFDEATSALDAQNEKIIMENLNTFFKGRTVMIIAHRLSTVKNADKIVVLENGEAVEIGNHFELVERKGRYFELVKNQLELGN